MIEKVFDKMYNLTSPQSTFTRIANRMLKEYKQVFTTDTIPCEVQAIADKIKRCDESESYDDEYENDMTCQSFDDKAYDVCHITEQTNIAAFFDEDEYGEPMYHVTWYFYACELYKKRVGDKKLTATSYDAIYDKTVMAKGKYRYFCTHRPPSCGCIPSGYVSYEVYRERSRYCGEATYDEEPPRDELINWGLVIDRDWERLRKITFERLQEAAQ